MVLRRSLSYTLVFLATVAPLSAQSLKFDDSIRGSIAAGCVGNHSVIIRSEPGHRKSVRDSLKARGKSVSAELTSIDAVVANVSCADLQALAKSGRYRRAS